MSLIFKLIFIIVLIKQNQSSNCDPLLLTPYIESNDLSTARRLSAVTNLDSSLNIKSYSGFLTVNKKFNSNLFFWFFPAQHEPETAPILLWLQGGPGASSMMALFTENGPFIVDQKMRLVRNQYSWTQNFSMIFIDNPVGTGFSYTKDTNGFVRNQVDVSQHLYEGLQQFFTIFSEYRKNDFYVTGESYAGKYVPAIGYKLHQMSKESNITFRGIAIGNGYIDPLNMLDIGSFLLSIGLIDEEEAIYFYDIQNRTAEAIKNRDFKQAFRLQDQLIGGDLTKTPTYFFNVTGYTYYLNFLQPDAPDQSEYWVSYLNQKSTQDAIHVGCVHYSPDNFTVESYLTEDQYDSVKPWIRDLMDNDYKVMIYNGNLDIIVALPLTNNFLKNLDWKYATELSKVKREVWRLDNQVVGYIRQVANFTQVVVRNAGHLVPQDQPRVALEMITKFVHSQPFVAERVSNA